MTRENKLALIIGFGLVLVVGILVSDHFSLAYTQDSARLASENGEITPLANRLNTPTLLVPTDEHAPPPPIVEGPARESETDRPANVTTRETDVQPVREQPVGHDLNVVQGPDLLQIRIDEEARGAAASSSPGQTPAAGDGFTWYSVKAGQTLSKIAAEVLGDAARWREIAAINTDRLPDPDNVREGVLIRIPVRAGSSESNPARTNTPPPPRRDDVAPNRAPQPRKHVVAKNENLSEIAQKYLGSAKKWRELYEANRDVIKDPDNVLVGTELTIPAR